MDRDEPPGADARHVFVFKAWRRVVRVGVAFGRDLCRPERDVGTARGGAAEHPAAVRDDYGVVPGNAAQGQPGDGDRGDDCGGGDLFGALASAAALVHAAVRNSFLCGVGAGTGRADAMGASAVPGAAAGGDDPVDEPARRILRGDRAGGDLRRGRAGTDGADGGPEVVAAADRSE